MTYEHDREWNFDPPAGMSSRDVGLEAVLKKLRYELTTCQGLLTEALKQIAANPQLEQTGIRPACPTCGITFAGAIPLTEHIYTSHDGPLPNHWTTVEANSLDPVDLNEEATT